MKFLFSFLVLSFFFVSAKAQQNPLIRACNLSGATAHIYQTSVQPYDENVFCDFGADSMIDSRSLILRIHGSDSQATVAFLQSQSCEAGGGQTVTLVDLDSKSGSFCSFQDGSFISSQALTTGHSGNAALLLALLNL